MSSRRRPRGADPDALEAEADEVAAAEQQLLARAGRRARPVWRSPAPSWPSASVARRGRTGTRGRGAAPRPTAARAWPGWPARWTRCARASSRSTTAWPGCPSASKRPPPARSRLRPSSRPCRAASVSSTRARSASTSTTTGPWPRCGWPTSVSPNCRPAERGAERQVASLRARIDALSVGLDRKDGAAWLTQNRSGAGLFGSVAKLVTVRSRLRGGRWPRSSVPPPTRWPPTASARPRLRCARSSRPTAAARPSCSSDWPARRAGADRRAARRRAVGPRPGRGAGAVARRVRRDARPASRWSAV